MDGYVYVRCMTGQRLVDGVIDHLVDQMVEALVASRPNVHRGAQADSLQTLQNLDVVPGVRTL